MASKDFIRGFISIYKSFPCLWQPKNIDYNNRTVRNEAYEDLVVFTQTYFSEANKHFVRQKIQNLRTTFRKELRKVNESRQSGTEVYVPRLWYFNLLLFTAGEDESVDGGSVHGDSEDGSEGWCDEVQGVVELVCPDSPRDDDREPNNSDVVHIQSPDQCASPHSSYAENTPAISTGRKRKQESVFKGQHDYPSSSTNTGNKAIKVDPPDMYDALASIWATKMRKLDEVQRILAEDLMNTVLKKAYFKELTRTTQIHDSQALGYEAEHLDDDENELLAEQQTCKFERLT